MGFGISAQVEGIPLFAISKHARGAVYPMLLKDSESVMLEVPEGNVLVYQHLLHLLKATSTVQMQIFDSLSALRVKVKALKKLLQGLADVDFTSINQIRMEVRVNGSYTFSQALAISDGMYQKMNCQKVCCIRIQLPGLIAWKIYPAVFRK